MAKQTTGRIKISASTREVIALAKNVYAKHLAEGPASLLLSLDGINWAVTGPKIAITETQHNQAEEFTRKAEDLYRQRDAGMAEINEALRASKNILKGKFTKNPKALGDWGFTVDDTPKIKKPAGV